MKYLLLIAFCFHTFLKGHSQQTQDFIILNEHLEEVSYDSMITDLSKVRLILFGEFHGNKTLHALQQKTYHSLNNYSQWALGMEMLERHQNRYLQEYLHGSMSLKTWLSVDQQWSNFEEDYLPLIIEAQNINAPVLATNIPRFLASILAKNGWDSLNSHLNQYPEQKLWLAELPILVDEEASGYREFKSMFGEGGAHGMDLSQLIAAQAIKDATMAESIIQFLQRNPYHHLFHIQGNFHNKDRSGILWYYHYLKAPYSYKSIEAYVTTDEDFNIEIHTKSDYYIIVKDFE